MIRLPKELYIPLAKVDTELLSVFEMSPIRVYRANKYLAYQYSRLAKARKNWDLALYWRISKALLNNSKAFRVAVLHKCKPDWVLLPTRKILKSMSVG